MNHFLRRDGLIIALFVMAFSLSGCVVKTGEVVFDLGRPLNSSEKIYVQYSDGTRSLQEDTVVSDPVNNKITVTTNPDKWTVGAYITNEENISWVPEYDYNFSTVVVTDIDGNLIKPATAADYALLQGTPVRDTDHPGFVS